jgi:GxxExxY protein
MEILLSLEEEQIGKQIVNASFIIHKALGPGLLEKVYEVCLSHELRKLGLNVERQLDIPIVYDGLTFEEGLRLDLLVENKVVIELQAVELVTGKRLGYLINFNVPLIKDGIRRYVNTK